MNKEPFRVAQMMTEMNLGGVEMVVMNYYRNIDKTKVQFDFFVLEGSSIPQKEEIERLGGRVFVLPHYTHIIKYEKEIIRLFKENKYKIVHSHMNTLSLFSLIGAKFAGVTNRILHNHSSAGKGETKKNIAKYILRPLSRLFATQFCACSKLAGNWIYGRRKFRVFNNAIDINKYKYDEIERGKLRAELCVEDKIVIGHIGRFCYQKNHSYLVDIFNEVLKKHENAVLMLIGEGELENEVRKKVYDLGISDNVLFLGRRTDAYRYYQAMDLFLLPSRYEGLPVVGVEAQACGLPCVFSDCVTKEARLLESIFYVKESIEEYVHAVENCMQFQRKDTSKEVAKAGFDIKNEASKLVLFYEELLS